MSPVLKAAGAYNLLWGAGVVLLPVAWTVGWTGIEVGNEAFWRCVGMIVGVYGIGYLCAARDPLTHWPITLVGFLGKTFGPIGYVIGAVRGEIPASMGWHNLTNDLIWWPFFLLILLRAWDRAAHRAGGEPEDAVPNLDDALAAATDQHGRALAELTAEQPRLVVAVRHAGCTFCRAELADLATKRQQIEAAGVGPVVLTLSKPAEAAAMLDRHGLGDVPFVSDPRRRVYRALELGRGDAWDLFRPRVWVRGARAFFAGHGVGPMDGDGFQMPGAFLIHRGRIITAHRHEDASDSPDFCALAARAA